MHEDPVDPLRRQLVDAILELAAQTNMHVAASAMGIDPPRLSDLRHGRIERFSLERLIRILDAVGQTVTLQVEGPMYVRWWLRVREQIARRKTRRRRRSATRTRWDGS